MKSNNRSGAAAPPTRSQGNNQQQLQQMELVGSKRVHTAREEHAFNAVQDEEGEAVTASREHAAADIPETGGGEPEDEYDQQVLPGQTSIHKFFGGKSLSGQGGPTPSKGAGANQKSYVFKPKRHPKSLLKEGVSTVRYLADTSQSIFQIIMPWRLELEEEEKKKMKKQRHEQEVKQQSLLKWVGKTSPAVSQQQHIISKEEEKYQQQLHDGELDANSDDFHKLQRVVKVKDVQLVRLQDYTQNVQAILINPKWEQSDHFIRIIGAGSFNSKASQGGGTGESTQGKTPSGNEDEDEEEEKVPSAGKKKAFKGISIEDFKKLTIPKSVMTDGILFIWVEKEYIMEVCKFLENQEFFYVENMCWVMLNENMKEEVEKTRTQDSTPAFIREDYTYLKKSKKTLLMFRRISKTDGSESAHAKLELRHQRTGDVVFDWYDPVNPFAKPQYYTYKLIETLLPKAMVDLKKSPHLKMIELWAQDDKPRKGWLKFMGLNQ